MNYKIIIIAIALLFFACEYPEADKKTEIPIVYANEKGIVTEQAIIKKFNLKNFSHDLSAFEGHTEGETAEPCSSFEDCKEEPKGNFITPFDFTYFIKRKDDFSFKLKQKGSRGSVTMWFLFSDGNSKRIDFWAVWK